MADENVPQHRSTEVAHAESEHAVELHVEHEKPEDWGWHHEFSMGRQVGGWFSFLVLLALLTTTHYNHAGSFAIILAMVFLAGGLIWDRQRRRTQWRS